MKKVFLTVLAIIFLGASCNVSKPAEEKIPYTDGQINMAGRSISFELADTVAAKARGLSGRAAIEENQGMLFMFPAADFPVFWMKDMNFPIDIIWIKADEIVDISLEAQPEPGVDDNNLKTFTPKIPADRVLEVKSGWATRNNLKTGDKVEIVQTIHSN
ncbi:MAG: DUF192 domain-containing protein [Candidatus Doudnabacteria bacterium]|nr:DUF192 domain-containing protein [Candidatus Doudnabacteria bacterium]